jgi:hypothetical protein
MMARNALPRWGLGLLSVVAPALLGCAAAYGAVRGFASYGWTLFLALPVLVSFLSAFFLRRFAPVRWAATYGVSLLSILLLGGLILLVALDGLICLLMALPLAAILALIGSAFGYTLASRLSARAGNVSSLIVLMTFPLFLGFEQAHPLEPPLRAVTSSIVIDAPIAAVWDEVITFDRITAPPTGIFRLGIAYPIQARIEGHGVGAIRHCIFSTGPFVEPITIWEPPHRLEFNVTANPLPMQEWSPYGHIDVPHLHDTFVSRHGRFALREENGRTVLEGTTWYFQRIAPDWYWHRFSDAIIHQIHGRVLEQIKRSSEAKAQRLAQQ